MEFIKNKREREEEFYRLWNEEIKVNTEFYRLIHGNDVLLLKGISKAEIKQILDFCDRYYKKFKFGELQCQFDEKLINQIYEDTQKGFLLIKHLFDY